MSLNYSSSYKNNANNIYQTRVSIDNSNTIDRITRLTTSQITKNSFENDFFNGTSFKDGNDLESLILPSGFSGPSSFP
jgi:hypothetical protein